MKRIRVIPVLLIRDGGLVKTVKFKDPKYVGDPINAVKIFNEKEVDEIVILDISASEAGHEPDFDRVCEIVSEAFIPLAYGGGITRVEQIQRLIAAGVEKVVVNSAMLNGLSLITEAAGIVGSQSVVACIDVKKNWLGKYKVVAKNGSKTLDSDPVSFAKKVVDAGAGELILQSVEQDGGFGGYDLELIEKVSREVPVPVVALGGASNIEDFAKAVASGASAVAAGSMFVFQRPHRAVLISYPSQKDLKEKLFLINEHKR